MQRQILPRRLVRPSSEEAGPPHSRAQHPGSLMVVREKQVAEAWQARSLWLALSTQRAWDTSAALVKEPCQLLLSRKVGNL